MSTERVRGRFAPSPSGRMHLGNVASSLVAWLSAKSAGGVVVLRIEDLDRGRCTREYAEQIARDFERLGLYWDEGGLSDGYLQSGCDDYYLSVLERISAVATVYPCFCTRAELHAASAPHASDGTPIYDGRCKRMSTSERERMLAERPAALRVEAPDREYSFDDRRLGRISQNLARECGDFVLRRSDGIFSYQLAVVADDIRMGVTEVVRGRDLADSTPRQLYLYDILDAPHPEYLHTPLLVAPDGKRLSKREKSLDLGKLFEISTPERIIGELAWRLGIIDRGEAVTPTEILGEFSREKLVRGDITIDEREFLEHIAR